MKSLKSEIDIKTIREGDSRYVAKELLNNNL